MNGTGQLEPSFSYAIFIGDALLPLHPALTCAIFQFARHYAHCSRNVQALRPLVLRKTGSEGLFLTKNTSLTSAHVLSIHYW